VYTVVLVEKLLRYVRSEFMPDKSSESFVRASESHQAWVMAIHPGAAPLAIHGVSDSAWAARRRVFFTTLDSFRSSLWIGLQRFGVRQATPRP
jgi:hypothetical protein